MISQLVRLAAAFVSIAASAAFAQGYPAKPIRILVPFAPGGNVDITARLVSPGLAEALGQPVVVENRPGAGGTIGADVVAKSPADGYTLLMGSNSTFSVAPSLYPKNPYNPLADFAPVIMIASAPFVLVVNPNLPAKSARELVAQAKDFPRKLTMSSAGTGSSNHLVGELFQEISGARFTHVPYKGSGQALTDLMGGQVDLHFDQITSAASHIQGGKLRALMVTAPQRVPMLPEVPTAAEAGYAAFEATNVTGLIAPAGTPRDVIEKLNAATQKVIAQAAVREKFAGIGAETTGGTPEQFAAYIRDDLSKWTRIVKDANVKVE
ncbi:MAG TPA: tripartite tricarboxylate transporter substrate binding protein [Usitatibacter sp.]|nr:tripartite tricarboxylate transporter substrate binding protein [Usitatibacter sp.]